VGMNDVMKLVWLVIPCAWVGGFAKGWLSETSLCNGMLYVLWVTKRSSKSETSWVYLCKQRSPI
jgi:hypothetical protein